MFQDSNELDFCKFGDRKWNNWQATRRINHPVNGLDTETYKGYAKIITDGYGNICDVDGIDSALEFLTTNKYRNHHNFFYNLRFDFQAVIKMLPEEDVKELYLTGKVEYEGYKLAYIPKKLFRINHSNHSYKYYDIAQFYLMKLEKAAELYLGEKKNEEGIDAARLNVDLGYWDERYEDVCKYCVHDSWLTQKLGVLLQETYKKALGFPPQRYLSQANVSKEYFNRVCDIPNPKKASKRVRRYAFNCYHGGRFEVLKKGWFDEVTLIDINSAYPWHISNLQQCTEGEWLWVEELDYDAIHGFYRCVVDVPPYILPPFMVNAPKRVKIFPVGEFAVFLTKKEIEVYSKYCDIKILGGYEFRGKDKKKPFKDAIMKIWELKKATDKEDFRYDVYKKTMNAFYGSFYEKIKKEGVYMPGKFFNPIYASEITANTRLDLYEEALKYRDRVIAFATDSVVVEGRVEMNNHKELGKFDVDKHGAGCVLKSGVYDIGGEQKLRGMERDKKIVYEGVEYENIFDYIKKKPELTEYPWTSSRPVGLGEAVRHHKIHSVKDINVWEKFTMVTQINGDIKRIWDDKFSRGGDLYERNIESRPIPVALLEQQARQGG